MNKDQDSKRTREQKGKDKDAAGQPSGKAGSQSQTKSDRHGDKKGAVLGEINGDGAKTEK